MSGEGNSSAVPCCCKPVQFLLGMWGVRTPVVGCLGHSPVSLGATSALRGGGAGWHRCCCCPGTQIAGIMRQFTVKWVLITEIRLARRTKKHPPPPSQQISVYTEMVRRWQEWECSCNIVQHACLPQSYSNRDSPLPSPPLLQSLLLKELAHPCCQMKPFPERAGWSHLGSMRL